MHTLLTHRNERVWRENDCLDLWEREALFVETGFSPHDCVGSFLMFQFLLTVQTYTPYSELESSNGMWV